MVIFRTSQVLEKIAANGAANADEKDLASSGGRNPSTTSTTVRTVPTDHRRLSDLSVPSLDDDDTCTDRSGDVDEEMASINGNLHAMPLPLSPRRVTRAVKSMVKRSDADMQIRRAKHNMKGQNTAEPNVVESSTNAVDTRKHLEQIVSGPMQIKRIADLGTPFNVYKETIFRDKSGSFIGNAVRRSYQKRRDMAISERRLNQSSHI